MYRCEEALASHSREFISCFNHTQIYIEYRGRSIIPCKLVLSFNGINHFCPRVIILRDELFQPSPVTIAHFSRPIFPKAHYSQSPLFPKSIFPKAHYSQSPLSRPVGILGRELSSNSYMCVGIMLFP